MTGERFYRRTLTKGRFVSFTVSVKETDLWLAVNPEAYRKELAFETKAFITRIRRELELYLSKNPLFKESFTPCPCSAKAPLVARQMALASLQAGVGPMAAVAGAVADLAGRELMKTAQEVIVENGGDIFIKVVRPVLIGVYAGSSPFTGKLAIKLKPGQTPAGVCTSSGTVGPAFSFGTADAALAIAPSAALADAAATALGNRVQKKEDLREAILAAEEISGLTGALLMKNDQIAAWGELELARL